MTSMTPQRQLTQYLIHEIDRRILLLRAAVAAYGQGVSLTSPHSRETGPRVGEQAIVKNP